MGGERMVIEMESGRWSDEMGEWGSAWVAIYPPLHFSDSLSDQEQTLSTPPFLVEGHKWTPFHSRGPRSDVSPPVPLYLCPHVPLR